MCPLSSPSDRARECAANVNGALQPCRLLLPCLPPPSRTGVRPGFLYLSRSSRHAVHFYSKFEAS
ncbi:hypothetical protein PpBr36_00760 [Pyricularia pennisetigena]|uniref:hypothetical protein n=1 Tax=Pyricularia pennisetigena TaxID=1578925 RepID=UPI00114DA507|nr:hypothetical protein PpBr36_00760 [Pyricularia pennisetigena]TLS27787.1 hypothetical protein PpBr36_00760 [Pyricularia pennisetigena]